VQRQASIPHSKPTLGKEEAAAAAEVVRSGYLAEGQRTVALETTLAETIGVKHAAAVNSGSSALHLALLALDVAEGDEVVVPSYVCTAVLNAVNYVGATPVLADVDDSLNLCPHDAKRRLSRKTKAVIVPHLLGNPAAIDELAELGPPIIEDCAQAIGATVPGGPPAQAGARGVLSVFSFYATKVLAAGECGAVASNSARLIGKVVDLKDYDERRSYRVRYNYKCNDLAAALALCQLRKLPRFLTRRRAIARQYASSLSELCRVLPSADAIEQAACFRFVALAPGRASAVTARLQERGISARRPIFKPLHRYLGQRGFPGSERAWRSAVSLPIYPGLRSSERDRVIQAARATLSPPQ